MNYNYNDIINKWFSKLPKGHALPPYNLNEMDALQESLIELGLSEFSAYKILQERSPEQAQQQEPPKEKLTRFHPESADYLKSPEHLRTFIEKRYIYPGLRFSIGSLYEDLRSLPGDYLQSIGKMISENTDRKLSGGTFRIGKYENTLKQLILKNVKIHKGIASHLWLAILLNGRVQGPGIVDVKFGDQGIAMKSLKSSSIDFGDLPLELMQNLKELSSLLKIIRPNSTNSNSTDSINQTLRLLVDPKIKGELEALLQIGQDSEIELVKSIANRIQNTTDGGSVDFLVTNFLQNADAAIATKLQEISKWVVVGKEMVFMKDVVDLYTDIKSENNQLSGNIIGLMNNKLYISTSAIKKLIRKKS